MSVIWLLATAVSLAEPPPDLPLPPCQQVEGQTVGACLDDEVSMFGTGRMSGRGRIGIQVDPRMPATQMLDRPDGWSPSPSFSETDIITSVRCAYLDMANDYAYRETSDCTSVLYMPGGDTFEYREASSIAFRPRRTNNCYDTSDFQVYYYGGPANQTNGKWSEHGPTSLDCALEILSGRPDGLLGPTWLLVRGGVDVVEQGFAFASFYSGEAAIPVDGDLRDEGPVATFTYEVQDDDDALTVDFTNASFHTFEAPLTYS